MHAYHKNFRFYMSGYPAAGTEPHTNQVQAEVASTT